MCQDQNKVNAFNIFLKNGFWGELQGEVTQCLRLTSKSPSGPPISNWRPDARNSCQSRPAAPGCWRPLPTSTRDPGFPSAPASSRRSPGRTAGHIKLLVLEMPTTVTHHMFRGKDSIYSPGRRSCLFSGSFIVI